MREPPPVVPSGGGSGESGPAKKKAPARKAPAKKAPAKKAPAKKKAEEAEEESGKETGCPEESEASKKKRRRSPPRKRQKRKRRRKRRRQERRPSRHVCEYRDGGGRFPASAIFLLPAISAGTIASASISTNISGETRAVIASMELAGGCRGKILRVLFPPFPSPQCWLEYAGADDIFERSSGAIECALNVLERLNRLRVDIARADILPSGQLRCTRYVDVRPLEPHESNRQWAPRCAAGNLDSLHFASFVLTRLFKQMRWNRLLAV